MKNLESYLNLIADMYRFDSDSHDTLNQIINDCADEELCEDDLEFVAAAGTHTSYAEFLAGLKDKK